MSSKGYPGDAYLLSCTLKEFYEGQSKSAQYFFNTEIPVTLGKMNAILETDGAAIEISEKSFGN